MTEDNYQWTEDECERLVKWMKDLMRPLSGLLTEYSECYREGKCKDCRTLREKVRCALAPAVKEAK